MKIKQTIAVLVGLVVAVNAYSQQGQITVNNGGTSRVTDSTTGGANVARDTALVGLYYSTDLNAVPNPAIGAAPDGFLLAASGPLQLSTSTSELLNGLFNLGAVSIPSTVPGDRIVLQVRAWSVGLPDYDAARNSGNPAVLYGFSNVLGQGTGVQLGGGVNPIPTTAALGLQGFVLNPVPEPSTIVLGLIGGLGAMLLLRRRK